MKVGKIAVIGSGVMGQGIAYVAAVGGFQVTLHDIKNGRLWIAPFRASSGI